MNDAAGACDCLVDDAVVAQCEVGIVLDPSDCGGEEIHVFKTCCVDVFAEVLLP